MKTLNKKINIKKTFQNYGGSLIIIWSAVILFLCLSVFFPLLRFLAEINFSSIRNIFSSAKNLQVIGNTFLECLCSSFLSVLTGYLFAYAIVIAKIPGKKFFNLVPVLHLITPPFVGGLSFILLAGRQGFITKTLLHLDISLYGFWGLLIAQTLCFFPIAYLICSQNLSTINPHLIESARSMGAGNLKIFFTVILPLSLPGLSASFLFIAVSVLSDFGNPLIVAGRFKVLSVEIYNQLTGWMNSSNAAAYGIILLIPSLILFYLQNRLIKKTSVKTATVGVKISSVGSAKCSLSAKIILTAIVSFISLIVLAQFISIIAGSFQKLWGVNTSFTVSHIKACGAYSKELFNSLGFAFIGASLSAILGLAAAFFVHRTNLPFKHFIDVVIQLPSCIPGTLFGLAISITANGMHFRSSKVLVTLAITIGFMPFAYRIISSSLSQIRTCLDDAAFSLGQNSFGVCTTILAPICADGLFNSFIYTFARGIGTVSAVIFLVSFDTPLASLKILNLAEQGDWGKAAALALELTILTFTILFAGRFLLNRFGRKSK